MAQPTKRKAKQATAHAPAVGGLAGEVGAPDPRYPGVNKPTATAQVDAQLALIAELRNAPLGAGGLTPGDLQMAKAVADFRRDRPGAIAGFQRTARVGTPEERQFRIILPNGTTWPALLQYGRVAGELDAVRDRTTDARDYVHTGKFDHAVFLDRAAKGLKANTATTGRYHDRSLPNFDRMLGFMETDSRIVDVRWMAYMLATAFWEAAQLVVVGQKKGKNITGWETVVPIDEKGHGGTRDYVRPAKVERINAAKSKVTEWDGNQFDVNSGRSNVNSKTGGAAFNTPASKTYLAAQGDALSFFGRGYVQLTWWYNYAAASFAIRGNHDLLHDPELVKDPDVAYQVMADGMLTGGHYANGHKLQDYLHGTTTNYAGARAIVNAREKNKEALEAIIEGSKVFEAALQVARR